MELKITADWVINKLGEYKYILKDAFWITTSDTIYATNSNYFWISKVLDDLGVADLSDNYTETNKITGIQHFHFCLGISFNDMERIKHSIPETYKDYIEVKNAHIIRRKKKLEKIIENTKLNNYN